MATYSKAEIAFLTKMAGRVPSSFLESNQMDCGGRKHKDWFNSILFADKNQIFPEVDGIV